MKERGRAIALIGFMGAGKSSVGRTLARITGLPRYDTDEMVAERFGLAIPQIFEVHGEEKFRDAETDVLRGFPVAGDPVILVTGGGIVLRRANVDLLRALGTLVHLQADESTLFQRISRRSNRPLLQTKNPRATVSELLAARLPLYRETADVEVDTSALTHEQVAQLILEKIERR